jgi:hypothetical protein
MSRGREGDPRQSCIQLQLLQSVARLSNLELKGPTLSENKTTWILLLPWPWPGRFV